MKQVLFGIFAHPDDESFGPSGTLASLAASGWEVHLLCVTDGSNGDETGKTQAIRNQELLHAGTLIGATSTTMLPFRDGSLCNRDYAEIATHIQDAIRTVLTAQKSSDTADKSHFKRSSVSFMTFERHGLTGHLDHIAVSMIVTHLYTSMEKWLPQHEAGWLKYFCFCDQQKAEDRSYFVYSPKGYREEDVDETVFIGDLIELKKQIIRAHASQEDAKKILSLGDHLLSQEHFIHYK